MRFSEIKRFTGSAPIDAVKYLRTFFNPGIKDLLVGLGHLSLTDNFDSFLWEGTIAANTTVEINHPLGATPSSRLILRQQGYALVTDSTTQWTKTSVFLRNEDAANSATLKVLFLK